MDINQHQDYWRDRSKPEPLLEGHQCGPKDNKRCEICGVRDLKDIIIFRTYLTSTILLPLLKGFGWIKWDWSIVLAPLWLPTASLVSMIIYFYLEFKWVKWGRE